jgi:phosphonopyruvate decarboxylase
MTQDAQVTKTIKYGDAVEVINRDRGNAIAVTTMTQTGHWNRISNRPDLDIGIANAMSKASSVGLGIALGAPNRRVLVMDGDGSLLMNMGSLVTIATQAPENFYHFLFQNDVYAITGGQPVPGVSRVDFVEVAKGSGYRDALTFDDIETFASDLPEIFARPGPVLIVIKSETLLPDTPPEQTWESNARMPAAFRSIRKDVAPSAD